MGVPRRWAAVILVVAGLSACAGDPAQDAGAQQSSTTSSAPPSAAATPSAAPAPGTALTTGDSEFGVMLFDPRGQAIYLFDKETAGTPDCYDECAVAWPPVLTDGAPQAGGEVRADLLGTVARADGSSQVTYAGHPLYFYAHEGPGQVLCHDVVEYGGTWLVVTPAGTPAP
jgi:predicted lipoprotein with Yx(FWY)xxD motif